MTILNVHLKHTLNRTLNCAKIF